MTTATLDYSQWAQLYPELSSTVTAGRAAALWAQAGLYLAPGEGSAVADVPARALILGLITAHLAALAAEAAQGATGLAGRISSATEGSVSVTMAPLTLPGGAEWYGLTSYGLAAWAALAPYRTARYVPGPGVAARGYGPYWRRGTI